MDRNIPHVRDIFSGERNICVYDSSPRSRRRRIEPRPLECRDADGGRKAKSETSEEMERRKNRPPNRIQEEQKWCAEHNINSQKDVKGKYSTKTLTERDIKHLERHLSMKKTIRKQISRNLAQAFVEDPQILEERASKNTDRSVTLTRAKMAKSEQTFLDMLKNKQDDTDSGHSSPTRYDEYSDDQEDVSASNCAEESTKMEKDQNETGKFSFWKMFTNRKNKR
uniref:Uncharacterized protein n=1 Tax=Hadrurus spadix TaxID=141984 RepID=A0A1W7RAE3_9SCOR